MSLSKNCETDKDFASDIQPNEQVTIKQSKISLLKQRHLCGTQDSLLSFHKETPLRASYQRYLHDSQIKCRGSYTIEAAVVLPIFLCCMISMMFFFRVLMVQAGVQSALDNTARKMALYGEIVTDLSENLKQQGTLGTAILLCESQIIANHTPTEYIAGGLTGIRYSESDVENQYIQLIAQYSLRLPLGIFGTHTIEVQQNSVSRKWIGWVPQEGKGAQGYVYVTKYGTSYHNSLRCAYLKPSIRTIAYEQMKEERNSSGGKYSTCPICHSKKAKKGDTVYITNYGDAYHTKLQCSGLKRTIYQILLTEAKGYTPCPKCVEE